MNGAREDEIDPLLSSGIPAHGVSFHVLSENDPLIDSKRSPPPLPTDPYLATPLTAYGRPASTPWDGRASSLNASLLDFRADNDNEVFG